MSETMNYPASGTLEDLSMTCGGDEDAFRGPLTSLSRDDSSGTQVTRATYEPIPPQQPYNKKMLFFFDITNLAPEEVGALADQQAAQHHELLFDNADVYLNNSEAQVAVYKD